MATRLQLTVDCADPARLVRFWTEAIGYVPEPPPGGAATWVEHWRSIGVPEAELDEIDDGGTSSIVDPGGVGPRIWFQPVPEPKVVKNRLHLDLGVSGGRTEPLAVRRDRVDREVERLLALGASTVRVLAEPGLDHYAVTLADPEGNEFCVH